jgi:hypothetical protein
MYFLLKVLNVYYCKPKTSPGFYPLRGLSLGNKAIPEMLEEMVFSESSGNQIPLI